MQTEEFQHFKREVYQKVLNIIFGSLRARSWQGEAMACGDNQIRILYPGIAILSLGLEEAWYFCTCRSSAAKHPCPKCLIHRDYLHKLLQTWPLQTSDSMQRVVQQARQLGKTRKEEMLRNHGIHDVEVSFFQVSTSLFTCWNQHFLWKLGFSDPYQAYSYDTLHSDDGGKFGRHLWPLLLDVLEKDRVKGKLTE